MNYALFTDVSLNPELKTGLGAYLLIPHSMLDIPPEKIDKSAILNQITFKTFNDTSSTKLELQTALWAIKEGMGKRSRAALALYTDSQCISGLMKRRDRLEINNYLSKRTGSLLKHALFYKTFYSLFDKFGFKIIKVTGHKPSKLHNSVHRIFSYVDKEVRRQLKSRLGKK
jgi:hypothetical protein